MRLSKSLLFVVLSFSLFSVSFLSLTPQSVFAQDTKIALQRGYRTGYSDGYMSGYRDSIDNAAKSFDKHSEYTKADRAYLQTYGSLEDYRDGYQQGFETGYNTGFEKRSFDAALPNNLNKRGVVAAAQTPLEPTVPLVVEEKTDNRAGCRNDRAADRRTADDYPNKLPNKPPSLRRKRRLKQRRLNSRR